VIQIVQEELDMSDHYWLSVAQVERIKPYFPLSHGVPRVDGRRVLSGIIHVLKRGRPVPAALRLPNTTLF
jgi:putative transposase